MQDSSSSKSYTFHKQSVTDAFTAKYKNICGKVRCRCVNVYEFELISYQDAVKSPNEGFLFYSVFAWKLSKDEHGVVLKHNAPLISNTEIKIDRKENTFCLVAHLKETRKL